MAPVRKALTSPSADEARETVVGCSPVDCLHTGRRRAQARMKSKIALLAVIAAVVGRFYFDLGAYLTLSKASSRGRRRCRRPSTQTRGGRADL